METVNVLSRDKDGLDLKELKQLTKDFRDWKPDKQLHKMLKVGADLIADDARVLAAKHSKSIPPTVRSRVTKTRLTVLAGGADVPIAGLFELGNKGKKSQAAALSGKFRHPTFGNRGAWVEQDMHPYLLPAAEMNKGKLEHLEGEAVAESFREYRFPVSTR